MSNLTKRQKDIGIIFLAILFLFSIVAFSYIRIYAPAKDANEMAIQTLANERDVLFALQRQEAQQDPSGSSSSRPLQEKVPVTPLEDVILLQIQKSEVKTEVIVNEVTFSLEDMIFESPPEHVENVKSIIANVQLDAEAYSQIDRFIEEIEAMERIFVMDRIEFIAPTEVRTIDEESDLMGVSLTFRAYFRPDLENLVDEVPKVDAPVPAGKRDPTPFNQMPGLGDSE